MRTSSRARRRVRCPGLFGEQGGAAAPNPGARCPPPNIYYCNSYHIIVVHCIDCLRKCQESARWGVRKGEEERGARVSAGGRAPLVVTARRRPAADASA